MKYMAKLGDYTLGRKLGIGQFSKVRIGSKDNAKYAIKYLPSTSDIFKNKVYLNLIFNEAKIMLQLDHPNIVHLFEFGDKGVIIKPSGKQIPVLYLIFELITGGEFFDYIAVSGRFPDKIARFYFRQLLNALNYIYSKGFAHRDIKMENILMDDKCNLKLADFGFATEMQGKDGTGKLHSKKGTMGYMAPELNIAQPYSGEKVDLFAAGVLLFTMIAQHPPFRRATADDSFYRMFCQQNETFWKKMATNKPPEVFSATFKSLINGMLELNPTKRFGMTEVFAHPWLNESTTTIEEVQEDIMNRQVRVECAWRDNAKAALLRKQAKKQDKLIKDAAHGGGMMWIGTKASAKDLTVQDAVRVITEYKV